MTADEERIALFLDYENLAIGAKEDLGGQRFDMRPLADALAERGRVVVRRAYADWSYFDEDRRMLTRQQVELIEIPQRLGAVRKNAADIKLAVDAIELVFEREYITTYVICTGDSDFTPLVAKLRELNKRVIGVGLEASTSKLLPPACDEFIFYERLEGVDLPPKRERGGRRRGQAARDSAATAADKPDKPAAVEEPAAEEPLEEVEADTPPDGGEPGTVEIGKLVTQTLSGLQRSSGGAVLASTLKRALLRKDPTFDEAQFGFRAFGELLRHLEDRRIIELSPGPARGDPEVSFPEESSSEEDAFELLRAVVADLQPVPLSGLKDQLRKRQPDFSEKEFGFGGFLQFCKAARAREIIRMRWDEAADDYLLELPDAG